jgi:hypothetical protein
MHTWGGGGLLINVDIFTQWCSFGGRLNATDVNRMKVWTIK